MRNKRFLETINASPQPLSSELIKQCLQQADAFWLYEGEPSSNRPHAELVSAKHSDGYVNVGDVLKKYRGIVRAFAMSIVSALQPKYDERITHVVGADTSSTALAADVANLLNAKHIRMKKHEDGEGKKQIWRQDNEPLVESDVILHIEELLTTSFSAARVREGIRRYNPKPTVHFVPFLPVVVERSNPDNRATTVEDSRVLPLLQLDIRNYDLNECPYCAAESEAIKPKEGDNWSRLTGR